MGTCDEASLSTAYISEMMTQLLGAGFVKGGSMSVAFVTPVYVGDRLTAAWLAGESVFVEARRDLLG